MSEEEDAAPGVHCFLWVFLTLVLGAIIRELGKRIGIPYTPTILVIGLVWGLVAEWIGEVGEAAIYVSEIYPVIST
jgi:hypothetical protein